MASAAAILGGALLPVPPAVSSAAADDSARPVQLTPETRIDPSNINPCLTASKAEGEAIKCRGVLLDPEPVPVIQDLVPFYVGEQIQPNCYPGERTPASLTMSVDVAVGTATASSFTRAESGAKWQQLGGSVAVTIEKKAGLFGLVTVGGSVTTTVFGSHTWVDGWQHEWTEALEKSYTFTGGIQDKVPAYSWGVPVFKPRYEQVRILWTWQEPSLLDESLTVRAGAIETRVMPARTSILPGTDEEGHVRLAGAWNLATVPMTPAEIDRCVAGHEPLMPERLEASFTAPTAPRYLDEMPMMYSVAPPTAPVLTRGSGTAALFRPTSEIVKSRSAGSTTLEPLVHSMQLTGNSEVAYWVGGNCQALTARVGYGTNLKYDDPGVSNDTISVVAASIDDGVVTEIEGGVLGSVTVPLVPRTGDFAQADVQRELNVAIPAGTTVIIVKNARGPGAFNEFSSRDPGVMLANPRLECSGEASPPLRSVYTDKEYEYSVSLAGTEKEIAADPQHFREPTLVEPGVACPNQAGIAPRTAVGTACGGGPLQVGYETFTRGIGTHSSQAGAGESIVRWENLPPTCTALTFGVGFHEIAPDQKATLVITRSALRSPDTGALLPFTVHRSTPLIGNGHSGLQTVHINDLGTGSRTIEIVLQSSAENYNGTMAIIDPRLSCKGQGSTVSKITPPVVDDRPGVRMPISAMEFTRSVSYWGSVKRDMSIDGKGLNAKPGEGAFGIGGIRGWSSGIAMHPANERGDGLVEVITAGRCQRISAWVGIDEAVGRNGSVRFTIYADGVPVATSPVKYGGQKPTYLNASIDGALTVTLAANYAGDDNRYDHANWGEPTLRCSSDPRFASTIDVADVTWDVEQNGWGPAERNMTLGEQGHRDGRPLNDLRIGAYGGDPNGPPWSSAIAVAPGPWSGYGSIISIVLGGNCHSFTAWVGVEGGVGNRGSVQFTATGFTGFTTIGTHTTGVIRGGQDPQFVKIDVRGADRLTLQVYNADDGNEWDHAIWANPTVYCS